MEMLCKRTFLCWFLAFLSWVQVVGQITKADSVIAAYQHLKSDTLKVNLLAAEANKLASSDPKQAVRVAKHAIELASSISYKKGVALACAEVGHAYERYTNNDSAFHYFFKGLKLYNLINNKFGQAYVMNYMAELHEIIGHFDSAAYYAYQSLQISQAIKHTDLAGKNYRVLGNIQINQNRLNEALENYTQALQFLTVKNNLTDQIARVHENIALVYTRQGNYAEAEKNFAEALNTYIKIKEVRGLARVNLNMAALRTAQGRYKEAIASTHYALNFYTRIEHPNGIAEALNQLSATYFEMKKYDLAITYAKRTLDILVKNMDRDLEFTALRLLQKSYAETEDYQQAYVYLEKATALGELIYSAKTEAILSDLQTRHRMEEKENEISLLNKDKELIAVKMSEQLVLRNALIVGALLLFGIGLLFFLNYRIAQRQKQQAERVRISSDLHDEVGGTLSSIGILSAFAAKQIEENKVDEIQSMLREISISATHMGEDINDIIWAINPRNDDFESTINRLRNFSSRIAEGKNIHLNFLAKHDLLKLNLPMGKRKNLLLVCKEAINNAVKYSNCKNLSVVFERQKNQLHCSISDDGQGFNVDEEHEGNGLKNMQYRAANMDAVLAICSSPQKGTSIKIVMKV